VSFSQAKIATKKWGKKRDGKTGAKEMASILDGKQKLLGSSINK